MLAVVYIKCSIIYLQLLFGGRQIIAIYKCNLDLASEYRQQYCIITIKLAKRLNYFYQKKEEIIITGDIGDNS